ARVNEPLRSSDRSISLAVSLLRDSLPPRGRTRTIMSEACFTALKSFPPHNIPQRTQHEREKTGPAQPRMVPTQRSRWIHAPQLAQEPGLPTRSARRAAGYRHLQYVVGAHA